VIETVSIVFGALLGAALGSFWACAAYRLPRDISLTGERSFCPSCQRSIPWYRNIPVISWLLLGGRSSCCRTPLSSRYLIIELLGALIGAALAALAGIWGPAALALVTVLIGFAAERQLVNRRLSQEQEIVEPEDD
jgi:prepilin signal peptidase PulO-like enzyme (type II secretory pathway)